MQQSLNFIHGKWHAWDGNSAVLLSDEIAKRLLSFANVDHCVDYLYSIGERDAARALNKAAKG